MRNFAQRICDKFHDRVYEVSIYCKNDKVVVDKAAYAKLMAEVPVLRKAAKIKTEKHIATAPPTASPLEPDQPRAIKVGDRSEPTPHGFFWEFARDERPYGVRDINNPHVGIMCKCRSKTEAAKYINEREREAAKAIAHEVEHAEP